MAKSLGHPGACVHTPHVSLFAIDPPVLEKKPQGVLLAAPSDQ